MSTIDSPPLRPRLKISDSFAVIVRSLGDEAIHAARSRGPSAETLPERAAKRRFGLLRHKGSSQ
jgi:hypothetical protein